MVKIDDHECKIIRELIRNPRISDNQISKNTKIPVMTVNRKRKNLEKAGIINYYTDVRHGLEGTADHNSKQLYIIKFKAGFTRTQYYQKMSKDTRMRKFTAEHVTLSYLGEKDGHLAIMMIINASTQQELIESFNGQIIPNFKRKFGDDSIVGIETFRLSEVSRIHHNYIPKLNMKDGKIKKDWPNEYIFVNKDSYYTEEQSNFLDY